MMKVIIFEVLYFLLSLIVTSVLSRKLNILGEWESFQAFLAVWRLIIDSLKLFVQIQPDTNWCGSELLEFQKHDGISLLVFGQGC